MKNKLVDLNNHLFAQLERLSDEELSGDKLTEEISRAKAVNGIASQIIANGNLVLNSIRTKEQYFGGKTALPEFFADSVPQLDAQPKKDTEQKRIPDNLKAEFQRD
jgi:hypothetical protein